MPGLIHTDGHVAMGMSRGLADELAPRTGCTLSFRPRRRPSLPRSCAQDRLAALEMIRSGTTTYTDMYYFEEEIARTAPKAAGLRGVLGETVIRFPAPDAKTPTDALARAERFFRGIQRRPAHHAGGGAAFRVPGGRTSCSPAARWH